METILTAIRRRPKCSGDRDNGGVENESGVTAPASRGAGLQAPGRAARGLRGSSPGFFIDSAWANTSGSRRAFFRHASGRLRDLLHPYDGRDLLDPLCLFQTAHAAHRSCNLLELGAVHLRGGYGLVNQDRRFLGGGGATLRQAPYLVREAYQRVLDRMLRRAAQCKLSPRPQRPFYPRAVWPRRNNFPKRKKP